MAGNGPMPTVGLRSVSGAKAPVTCRLTGMAGGRRGQANQVLLERLIAGSVFRGFMGTLSVYVRSENRSLRIGPSGDLSPCMCLESLNQRHSGCKDIGKRAAPAVWTEAPKKRIKNLSGLRRDIDEALGSRRPAFRWFFIVCVRKPNYPRKKLVARCGLMCRPSQQNILRDEIERT